MPETLASIRHSGVSKRRNNLEKSFRQAVISGGSSPAGKQSEGLPAGTSHKVLLTRFSHAERNGWEGNDQGRKGKEGEEMKLLETYYPSPSNILNKRQPWLCFACCFPFKVLSRFAKNSITRHDKICQAKNPAKLSTPWNIPWNIFLAGLVRTD